MNQTRIEPEKRFERDDRSLRELFRELSGEAITLVRQEAEFAKTEMSKKTSRAIKDIGFLAVGGAIAYAGLLGLIAAAIIGLANALPSWLSALIIGFAVATIGLVMVAFGADRLRKEPPIPRKAMESMEEDRSWLQKNMR